MRYVPTTVVAVVISVQVEPSSLLYSQALAMLEVGHDRVAASFSPDAAVRPVGLAGSAAGVAEAKSDAGPMALLRRARTWKVYSVSLVGLLTVWVTVDAPLPGMAVQPPEADGVALTGPNGFAAANGVAVTSPSTLPTSASEESSARTWKV